MPIQRRKVGKAYKYRYGDSGKWYDSRRKALKQMAAIKADQERRKKAKA